MRWKVRQWLCGTLDLGIRVERYDESRPNLSIVRRPASAKLSNLRAADHWGSRKTLERRHQEHPELLRRRRAGEHRKRSGKGIGTLTFDQTEGVDWIRADWFTVLARFAQLLALYADVGTGRVGQWAQGQLHAMSRRQLADYIGLPWYRDSAGVLRCWQLDRAICRFVAAGLIKRFQRPAGEDGANEIGELYVTRKFWDASHVARARVRDKRDAEAADERPRPGSGDAASVVQQLAQQSAHRAADAYGPNAPGVRARGRPPPN